MSIGINLGEDQVFPIKIKNKKNKLPKNIKLYIEEGKRRSRIRKAERYVTFKSNGSNCGHCHSEWHSCPFQEDMNGNHDSHHCRCCSECEHNCAMDI